MARLVKVYCAPMKLLVADKFSEGHLRELGALGLDVDYRPKLSAADLPSQLGGVSLLIVRSTEVTAQAIEAADALTLVVRAGAGVNTIDRNAASRRAIFVANCPGKNAIAVAELVMGILCAIDRRIPDQVAELRQGRWNKQDYGVADGLFGRTLGILGLGSIGTEVAVRAKAFGMHVVAWSRSLSEAGARALDVERLDSPEEVARRSDAVSVHLALAPETRGLCGASFFAALKARAIFINTARAEVVDALALERAVREQGIRVGLDVHAGEPDTGTGQLASPLLALPTVVGTHHVGASTRQAEAAIAAEAARIVRAFVERGEVPNCVNLCKRSPARWQLVVRHYDRVGVLAHVLGSLRRHAINVEEMDNHVFDGAVAACCAIRLSREPPADCLAEIRGRTDEVLHASLLPLPE
jgi:D-3-phosphoglycerate dehydrogenase